MNNKEKFLNMLGLAKAAGKIVSGEEATIKAIQNQKAKLVIVASDASLNTKNSFSKKCYFYNIILIDDLTTAEISKSIGMTMRKSVAILDDGFAQALLKLKRGDNDEG